MKELILKCECGENIPLEVEEEEEVFVECPGCTQQIVGIAGEEYIQLQYIEEVG